LEITPPHRKEPLLFCSASTGTAIKNQFTWKKKDKKACLLGKRTIKNLFTWKKKDKKTSLLGKRKTKKPVYLEKER
jgi:hypothetical protein